MDQNVELHRRDPAFGTDNTGLTGNIGSGIKMLFEVEQLTASWIMVVEKVYLLIS